MRRILSRVLHSQVLRIQLDKNYFNPNGKDFLRNERTLHQARQYLKKNKILTIVPLYNELSRGDFEGTLRYLEVLFGKNALLVIDGDSTDGSYEKVQSLGINIVRARDIEKAYNWKKIETNLGIGYPLPSGKGRGHLAAAVVIYLLKKNHQQSPAGIIFHDADIRNPWECDISSWFGWVLQQRNTKNVVQIKPAQPNRWNETFLYLFSAFQHKNKVLDVYFNSLKYLKWPLSGISYLQTSTFLRQAFTTGYSIEVLTDFSVADLLESEKSIRAQVEIPHYVRDGDNSREKLAALYTTILVTLDVLSSVVFSKGKKIKEMDVLDFKDVNTELQKREGESNHTFSIPVIKENKGPNSEIEMKLERIFPSVTYLFDNHYIHEKKLIHLFDNLNIAC